MPDVEDRNERARRIVNRWLAQYAARVDDEIELSLTGVRMHVSLACLEREIAAEIDRAERAAWCKATEALKSTG